MLHREERVFDSLIDHYVIACIVLALFVLSLIGVGNLPVACLAGLLLCLAGLTQRRARVDLWVFVPLLVYVLMCFASAAAAGEDISAGYGPFHALFPTVYLLACCLEEGDRRSLKLCCALWTAAAGGAGIAAFVFRAVTRGSAGRMGGILGNPNAMGIFLVMGWFLVLCCTEADKTLSPLEPLVLMGAAMTLSMGSFVAMAVGVLVLLAEKKRRAGWGDTLAYACRVLAKASLGMGTGLLIYLAGARTGAPWLTLPLAAYGVALMALWRQFEEFLEAKPTLAALLTAGGVLVAAAAIAVRPSALDTFAERLEMMGSGLHYLTQSPLLGVGPFQWRLLDLHDGGTYFNTWHIHNAVLHVGVEMGWIAMAALVIIALRVLTRPASPAGRALAAAYLAHNMLDTSFFYLGVTALALTAAGGLEQEGRELDGKWIRLLFACLAALFLYGLYRWITRA